MMTDNTETAPMMTDNEAETPARRIARIRAARTDLDASLDKARHATDRLRARSFACRALLWLLWPMARLGAFGLRRLDRIAAAEIARLEQEAAAPGGRAR